MDSAGVQKLPNAKPPQTIRNASTQTAPGHGSTAQTTAEPRTARRSGGRRPYRSDACPTSGAQAASIAALTRYVAPTAAAPQPSADNRSGPRTDRFPNSSAGRSEEHTSELQSRFDLVCRLLLEKKKTQTSRRG